MTSRRHIDCLGKYFEVVIDVWVWQFIATLKQPLNRHFEA